MIIIVSVSDEVSVQVIDTMDTTVVCVQKIIVRPNSFSHRMTIIDLFAIRNRENICSSVINVFCRVSDSDGAILLETIHRTGVHMMSSEFRTPDGFCFPTLREERGVFFHAPNMAQNRGVWGK